MKHGVATGSTTLECAGSFSVNELHLLMKLAAASKDAQADAPMYGVLDEMMIESLPTNPRIPANWDSSAGMVLTYLCFFSLTQNRRAVAFKSTSSVPSKAAPTTLDQASL